LEDLESCPEEMSYDDLEDKIDRITDEFLDLLLDEIKENKDLTLKQ
jgi:hypothetical protein